MSQTTVTHQIHIQNTLLNIFQTYMKLMCSTLLHLTPFPKPLLSPTIVLMIQDRSTRGRSRRSKPKRTPKALQRRIQKVSLSGWVKRGCNKHDNQVIGDKARLKWIVMTNKKNRAQTTRGQQHFFPHYQTIKRNF